jgi:hypothetical protein
VESPPPAATASGAASQGAPGATGRTVFYQPLRLRDEALSGQEATSPAERSTVRAGEYFAAPYVDRAGGPLGAGSIRSSAEVSALPVTSIARTMMLEDRILITPPRGSSASRGTRYLAYALGPTLEGSGQVVIPTGIVVVDRASAGEPIEARVIAVFGPVTSGQGLIPLGAAPPATLPRPAATRGLVTRVLWVEGSPALPTLQSYVVLNAGSAARLTAGDQVTLERPGTADGPGAPIARAVVVRVMPRAATALVIEQLRAEIEAGVLARVTAKMP